MHTGERPFVCDFPDCGKAFAQKSTLTMHNRTHTGERPYICDVGECREAFAQSGSLWGHVRSHHTAVHNARKKIEEERVRSKLLAVGYTEFFHTELLPPPAHFKREHHIDFRCADASADGQSCRIDFVINTDRGGYVFLEVDEHQHPKGADQSCDSKRTASVHTSIFTEAALRGGDPPPIYWLRYNPHAWHVNSGLKRIRKDEREARLCAFLKTITFNTDDKEAASVAIGYAFYDYTTDGANGGLAVVAHPEYPETLRRITTNLKGLEGAGGSSSSGEASGEEESEEEEEECMECA